MAYEIIVTKDDAGISPKGFLKKTLDVPYTKLFKLIKEKRLTLNGKKIKAEDKLSNGDVIKVWLDEIKLRERGERATEKTDLKIPIIFENENFLVLNKLAGVVVQGAQGHDTSLSLYLNFLKEKNGDDTDYFHVHRLDKDTSGVLVCSKNRIALRELNEIFRTREIVKKYVCLCVGSFKEKTGEVEVYLDRTPQGSKDKMKVVEEDGKRSLSIYNVIEEFSFNSQPLSLVEVEIKTGITHQIRVHMKYLGHPIVGDKMYGNSFVNKEFESVLDRQFLHAKSLEFEFEGVKHNFEAEFPSDLKKTIDLIS